MVKKRAFTLIELLVVISIISLLLSILMPSLSKARKQAKSAVCKSNLKQQQLGMELYWSEYDGETFSYLGGKTQIGRVYLVPLEPMLQNVDEIRFCPEASEIPHDDLGYGSVGSAKRPWLWHVGEVHEYGSYAINGWLYGISANHWMANSEEAFRKVNAVQHPTQTPLFVDANWLDVWPDNYMAVSPALNLSEGGTGHMERLMINRHNMKTNIAFVDGHVEEVELYDLYTFYWHRLSKPNYNMYWPF